MKSLFVSSSRLLISKPITCTKIMSRSLSSNVSVELIKALREKSGAPMMECKKALLDAEVGGDVDKAMDYLRAKGIAKATNNTRVSAEGLIGVYENNGIYTIVEVNSETDFVSRNIGFQEFVAKIAIAANSLGSQGLVEMSSLLTQKDVTQTQGAAIQSLLGDIVASIRENIVIRRAENIVSNTDDLLSAAYVHGKLGGDVSLDGGATSVQLGREASVVTLQLYKSGGAAPTLDTQKRSELSTAAKRLAMHVVAAKPKYLTSSEVPPSVLQSETAVMREQALASPPKNMAMLDKVVEGKVSKRLAEMSLTGQTHMAVEGAPVIAKYLVDLGKDSGAPGLHLTAFRHWSLGQTSA